MGNPGRRGSLVLIVVVALTSSAAARAADAAQAVDPADAVSLEIPPVVDDAVLPAVPAPSSPRRSRVIGAVPEPDDAMAAPVPAARDVAPGNDVVDVADAAASAHLRARTASAGPRASPPSPSTPPPDVPAARRLLAGGLAGLSGVGGAVLGATCAAPVAALAGPCVGSFIVAGAGLAGCCVASGLGAGVYASRDDAPLVGAGGGLGGLAGALVGATGGALAGFGVTVACGPGCSSGALIPIGALLGGASLALAGGVLGAAVPAALFAQPEAGDSYVAVDPNAEGVAVVPSPVVVDAPAGAPPSLVPDVVD